MEPPYRKMLSALRTGAWYDAGAGQRWRGTSLGRRCAGIGKLELYRFVENSVLPRLKSERQDFTGGLFGLHRVHMHAAGVPYCGVSFGYTTQLEWRGSADPRAGRSKKNFSSIELQ